MQGKNEMVGRKMSAEDTPAFNKFLEILRAQEAVVGKGKLDMFFMGKTDGETGIYASDVFISSGEDGQTVTLSKQVVVSVPKGDCQNFAYLPEYDMRVPIDDMDLVKMTCTLFEKPGLGTIIQVQVDAPVKMLDKAVASGPFKDFATADDPAFFNLVPAGAAIESFNIVTEKGVVLHSLMAFMRTTPREPASMSSDLGAMTFDAAEFDPNGIGYRKVVRQADGKLIVANGVKLGNTVKWDVENQVVVE